MPLKQSEAIVLRTYPLHEADLLVTLFTRLEGKVKGVAKAAKKSRRRFAGALEPLTCVRGFWEDRERRELARIDSCEVLTSPLSSQVDYPRIVALGHVAEMLDEMLPEREANDAIYRLAISVLANLNSNAIWMPVTYFALWMNRLMGWMPELGHCAVCGLDLHGATVWTSSTSNGVTCADDRVAGSEALSADSVMQAWRVFRGSVKELAEEEWPRERAADLRRFAIASLERHLEGRLMTALALGRG